MRGQQGYLPWTRRKRQLKLSRRRHESSTQPSTTVLSFNNHRPLPPGYLILNGLSRNDPAAHRVPGLVCPPYYFSRELGSEVGMASAMGDPKPPAFSDARAQSFRANWWKPLKYHIIIVLCAASSATLLLLGVYEHYYCTRGVLLFDSTRRWLNVLPDSLQGGRAMGSRTRTCAN